MVKEIYKQTCRCHPLPESISDATMGQRWRLWGHVKPLGKSGIVMKSKSRTEILRTTRLISWKDTWGYQQRTEFSRQIWHSGYENSGFPKHKHSDQVIVQSTSVWVLTKTLDPQEWIPETETAWESRKRALGNHPGEYLSYIEIGEYFGEYLVVSWHLVNI